MGSSQDSVDSGFSLLPDKREKDMKTTCSSMLACGLVASLAIGQCAFADEREDYRKKREATHQHPMQAEKERSEAWKKERDAAFEERKREHEAEREAMKREHEAMKQEHEAEVEAMKKRHEAERESHQAEMERHRAESEARHETSLKKTGKAEKEKKSKKD